MVEIIHTNAAEEPTSEELEQLHSSGLTAILAYLKSNPYINRDLYYDYCGKRFELANRIIAIENKGWIIDRTKRTDRDENGKLKRGLNYSLLGYEEGHRHIPTHRKQVVEQDYLFIGTLRDDKLRTVFAHRTPLTAVIIDKLCELSQGVKLITAGDDAIELLIPCDDLVSLSANEARGD